MSQSIFKGKTFVTTGLDYRDEAFVKDKVESEGGCFKQHFVVSLDYLVYNPDYYVETVKLRKTKELIAKGKSAKIITLQVFMYYLNNSEEFLAKGDSDDLSLNSSTFTADEFTFRKYFGLAEDAIVRIPDGIIYIGERAFAGCKNVKQIILPNSLEFIGSEAFANCDNLESINLPDGIKEIGDNAFSHCLELKSIVLPKGIKEIAHGVFIACERLTEIIIPEGITGIGIRACAGCKSLKNISLPNTLKEIDSGAFWMCSSLETVSFGNSLIVLGVDAFKECSNLKRITLPPSVIKIEFCAFEACDGLEEVSIANVKEIQFEAFKDCTSLKTILISDALKEIGSCAFSNVPEEAFTNYCGGLYLGSKSNPYHWLIGVAEDAEIVRINERALKIANQALANTWMLDELVIPKQITKLNTTVCSHKVTFYDSMVNASEMIPYGKSYSFDAEILSEEGETKYVIPLHCDGTERMDNLLRKSWGAGNAFNFKELDNYFDYIKRVDAKIQTALTRVRYPYDLGENVRKQYLAYLYDKSKQILLQCIESNDLELLNFMGSNGLIKTANIKLLISRAVEKNAVGFTAYMLEYNNMPKDSIPAVPKVEKKSKKKEPSLSNWEFKIRPDGTYEITKYKGRKTEVEIPDEYHGVKISTIGISAFSGDRAKSCQSIEKIVIPETVTRIGDKAFYHCVNLKDLTLPSSLVSIGEMAFVACSKMGSFNLPESVKEIGYGAFADCSGIREFTFPTQVKEVSSKVLMGCSSLESIAFPEGLKTIGTLSFKGCKALRSVFIPKYVSLDNSAGSPFEGCTSLFKIDVDSKSKIYTSIDGVLFDKDGKRIVRYPDAKGKSYSIPDGVEVIGKFAFSGNNDLRSVFFSDSVRIIEKGAFYGCRSLHHVTLSENLEIVGESAFTLCGITKIDIPKSLKVIDKNAFSSCKLKSIVIPEGTGEIGYEAFSRNWGLEKVILPASLTRIETGFCGNEIFDQHFKGTGKVYAPKGSEAERYCKEKGIQLVESPDSF